MIELCLTEDPRLDAFLQVFIDLPNEERVQWTKVMGEPFEPGQAAALAYTSPGPVWSIETHDGEVLVVTGATFIRSGVYRVWYAARPKAWAHYGEEVTNITEGLIQVMFHDFGAHRLEVICLPERQKARRWYEKHLGLQFEARMAKFCADGTDAVLYAAVRGD
jgi:hypothetical protein